MRDILRWTLHWLSALGATPYVPSPERIYVVSEESRVFDVPAESRTYMVS